MTDFPNIDTTKSNAASHFDDHPAHHNELALRIEGLRDSLDDWVGQDNVDAELVLPPNWSGDVVGKRFGDIVHLQGSSSHLVGLLPFPFVVATIEATDCWPIVDVVFPVSIHYSISSGTGPFGRQTIRCTVSPDGTITAGEIPAAATVYVQRLGFDTITYRTGAVI